MLVRDKFGYGTNRPRSSARVGPEVGVELKIAHRSASTFGY